MRAAFELVIHHHRRRPTRRCRCPVPIGVRGCLDATLRTFARVEKPQVTTTLLVSPDRDLLCIGGRQHFWRLERHLQKRTGKTAAIDSRACTNHRHTVSLSRYLAPK